MEMYFDGIEPYYDELAATDIIRLHISTVQQLTQQGYETRELAEVFNKNKIAGRSNYTHKQFDKLITQQGGKEIFLSKSYIDWFKGSQLSVTRLLDIHRNEIIKLKNEQYTTNKELAEMYTQRFNRTITDSNLRTFINIKKLPTITDIETQKYRTVAPLKPHEPDIVRKYKEEKQDIKEIATFYNVPMYTVKMYITEFLKLDKVKTQLELIEENKQIVIEMSAQGYNVTEIAEVYQREVDEVITAVQVLTYIRQNNIHVDRKTIHANALERAKKTNLERYGAENPYASEEIKEKIKQHHLEKYGVENQAFEHANKDFLPTLLDPGKLHTFLYDHAFETGQLITLAELEKKSGIKYYNLSKRLRSYGLSHMFRVPLSKIEEELYTLLVDTGFTNITKHERSILKGQEIDLYLPDLKIGFECNPSYTHNSTEGTHWGVTPKHRKYHQQKSINAEQEGIRLIHVYDWDMDNENFKTYLKTLVEQQQTLQARKLNLQEVSKEEEALFLNTYHLQGYVASSLCLGLYQEDELVQLMSFRSPRFKTKDADVELLRLCTKQGVNILAGTQRLFKNALKYMNDSVIICYSDYSKFTGDVYNKLGFMYEGLTEPNYRWIHKHTGETLTRYQTQMKDERQIMESKGFVKVYDAGNKRWLYRYNTN